MIDLTEWATEIQRLSKAIGYMGAPQHVSLSFVNNFDRITGKKLPGPEWLWRADVGFLIVEDFNNRSGYEGMREFSAATVEEAARAAIVALKKRLSEKIEIQRKELERLENENTPFKDSRN